MEKQNYVVSEADLQKALKLKGAVGRFVTRRIHRLLEIDKINAMQEKFKDYEGPEFSEKVLEEVGVTYEVLPEQLSRIPEEGGFITVSNHHFGSIDGLILSSVIGSRRPDYKILTTFVLALIPGLRDSFMPVDNLSKGGSTRSYKGIKMALRHIQDGGALGFFPAGEVATYQKKRNRTAVGEKKVIEDKPWAHNVIKIIRKSGFPVIPIYFEGTNSRFFHFLGKIHPRLRTIRLIHELLNKQGTRVKVRIGHPISPEEIQKHSGNDLGAYLRNRTYALEAECLEQFTAEPAVEISEDLAAPVDPAVVRGEMASISDRILFEVGDYRCYLTTVDGIPNAMYELARLREETFRAVGEGTGKAIDTDEFDPYFHHLILWSIPNEEIVGAYRIGVGSELIKNHEGISGFYTSTLFRYSEGNEELMSQCLELGRSFVAQKYQREVLALKLLLTGVSASTTKFSNARYFLGPVSISNAIPDFYKSLMVHYIETTQSNGQVRRVASPTHPFKPNYLAVNPDVLLEGIENVDELDRLILTISDGKYRIPVLVKKYFSYNAKLICFNVDPLFNDSLDGLILLKLSEFPKNYMRSLIKALPEEQQQAILTDGFGS
jgi:putative hemolysin